VPQIKFGKFNLGKWEPTVGQTLGYATTRNSGGDSRQVLLL
jgi:hypothetical protein